MDLKVVSNPAPQSSSANAMGWRGEPEDEPWPDCSYRLSPDPRLLGIDERGMDGIEPGARGCMDREGSLERVRGRWVRWSEVGVVPRYDCGVSRVGGWSREGRRGEQGEGKG
jgi:hypothetical protein